VSRVSPTAEFASLVYGPTRADPDDPAELYHEASRLYPNVAPRRLGALLELAHSEELQQTVARSSRTHAHRPGLELQRGSLPDATLRELLAARRSRASAERRRLCLPELGALLEAAYSATAGRRTVPSAGALYPLEVYVLALAVAGTTRSTFHYDPFRHRLACLGSLELRDVEAALVDASLAERAAALVVLTGVFWRSRFKYGLRGYRFALLEAGHVVQNLVLAATSLGVPALPVGGYYDRRLDALVGADGLDEASLYAVLLGGRT